MIVRQGDLYWFDFGVPRGSEPGYRRPVVVVQSDGFNASSLPTILICAITTQIRLAGRIGNVLLHAGEGNLTRDSVVLVTQVATLDKGFLDDYIGALPWQRMHEIHAGLRLVTELTRDDDLDLF